MKTHKGILTDEWKIGEKDLGAKDESALRRAGGGRREAGR